MYKGFLIGIVFYLLICIGKGDAQALYPYKNKKEPAIGIHFSLYDFNSAALLHTAGLSQTLQSGSFTNIGNMQPGLAVSFQNGLTDHLDYVVRYTGAFVTYPFPNYNAYAEEEPYLLSSLDSYLELKLFSDRYWVSPFLSGGIGAFDYQGSFGAYMPLGAGMQVNFFDQAFLFCHVQYNVGVSENAAPTFYYSIGVAGNIGSDKKK
jgi:OOP family OmpA-OmpF porin